MIALAAVGALVAFVVCMVGSLWAGGAVALLAFIVLMIGVSRRLHDA